MKLYVKKENITSKYYYEKIRDESYEPNFLYVLKLWGLRITK